MIDYVTIREGIAACVMQAFPDLPIDDEDGFHVNGPAILVRLVENSHVLDDPRHVHRYLDFNVDYLAPLDAKKADIINDGLRLAGCLQPTIAFGNREITVSDIETRIIDKDFQVDFSLEFYDELREAKEYELMQALEFHLMLGVKE